MNRLPKHRLHVNRNFERIYSSECCEGDFCSCMVDKGYHGFYENSVNASAAYLENEEGKVIARCIIYNEVEDQDGKIWRLAERQYSSGNSEILKRALVDALVKENHIDGYKKVGAGCHEARNFVDVEGNSLSDKGSVSPVIWIGTTTCLIRTVSSITTTARVWLIITRKAVFFWM